jgi:hypothetical protein
MMISEERLSRVKHFRSFDNGYQQHLLLLIIIIIIIIMALQILSFWGKLGLFLIS